MRYKTVIFDLDGTLIDTKPGIQHSMRAMFTEMGVPMPSEATMLSMIGPPLLDSYTKILGMETEKAWECIRVYRAHYAKEGLYIGNAYQGIPELLHEMNEVGTIVSVATSKMELYARETLRCMGILSEIKRLCGPDADGMSASKTDLIRMAMEGEPEPCLMIGDRKYDIEGAKEAGIDCAAVLYGYGPYEELSQCGPTYFAKDAAELRRIWLGG